MAQPQYYEILNQTDKNPEQQFFTNVEDQTVHYVIPPDKNQAQFPSQQITQEQALHTQVIQQPIQIQAPQYAVIKDGTIRTTEGQQIFFVENAIPDGIVIEKSIQHTQQPIVLNHQLAQTTIVRGPIMKAGPNQQISLELIQKQKLIPRPQNPNQQVRQLSPSVSQIRQQSPVGAKSTGQVHSPNVNQTVMRPQQVRQGLVRTGQTQYRPQQTSLIRHTESNQVRQQLRVPNQPVQHRPSLLRGSNASASPRAQGIGQTQQQSPQVPKFNNQGSTMTDNEMKSSEDDEAISLPDGKLVTMASYKKMLAEQKARNSTPKSSILQQNTVQQNSPVQQNSGVQTSTVQQTLLQQNSAIGNTNIRPQATKKRNPTPRAPRVPAAKGPRNSKARLSQVNNQQPTNTQGHFSMLNQLHQVNKPQPQQFQNQIQMPTPSIVQQQSQNQQVTHQNQIQQQSTPPQQQPTQIQQQQQLTQLQSQPPTPFQQQSGLLQQQAQIQQHQQQQQGQILQQQHQQQPQVQQQTQVKTSQANFVIQPPKANQKPAQQRPLPVSIPSSRIQQIIESTPISEEFSDSIRMLVLLENGEQRLITFTLPKEACTIQEILEQVNVPFQNDTNIQVIETNSDGINYIVTVGNVPNLGFADDEMLPTGEKPPTPPAARTQPPPGQPRLQPQPQSQPAPTQQLPRSQTPKPVPPVTPPAVLQKSPEMPPSKSPSPEPAKEIPKFVSGMLALCGGCGYLSEDFNKCIRCSRKLPDTVKSISANLKGNPVQKRDIAAVALAQQQKHAALQLQQQQQLQSENQQSQVQSKINSSPVAKVPSPQKKKGSRAKTLEESVHVISSDEEDEEKPKFSENILQKLGNSVTICPISKEPSTIDIQRHCTSKTNVPSKVYNEKDLVRTKLKCRTVRIGSYRCIPEEEIIIDSFGVTMKVPHPSKENGTKIITLEKSDMVKVLASFNSSLPVIFYYLNSSLAAKVREELDMISDSDYYFDPLSLEDEAQRRITLLPDDITDDHKNVFQLIYGFPVNILEELNIKEANDILIKTCPKDLARTTPGLGGFSEIKQLLTYPPEGRYRITVNTEDYICLGQDQFLNDVIIDFFLTYLVENLPVHKKSKIHVFSTFFYRRLTTKPVKASRKSQPSELDPTLTPAQKRHARVQKWTKNVNLFDKDFVIIPINENAHWFLAIICFPGMNGCHTWDDKPYKLEVKSARKKKLATVNVGNIAVTIKQEKIAKLIPSEDIELSDKDEAEGDESEMESDDSEELPLSQNGQPTISTPVSAVSTLLGIPITTAPVSTRTPKEVRPPLRQPCILIFDSLSGASRSRVVATLRDYLTCEYKSKMGKEKIYNKDVIKGACPKVPQQNNFTDCGLYLLQYVEQFFKDPIKDFHIPIKEVKNWFEEMTVTKKREDIANLIKRLMKEYGKDLRLVPDIGFPTLNGKLVERDMEEEEEDEEMMEDEDSFETMRGSSLSLNMSKDSLSDTISNESDLKTDESGSPLKPSNENISSDFVTQPVVNPKPDLSEFPRQTSKDTLSILKAKRIIRHKNAEGPFVKKLKSEQE